METVTEKQEKGNDNIHNVQDGIDDTVNGHLVELEVDLARVIAEDDVEGDWDADTSPFPVVRAVVPESDDPDMPVNTFRAWFLGIVGEMLSNLIRWFDMLTLDSRCSYSSVRASTSSLPSDIQACTSSVWSLS